MKKILILIMLLACASLATGEDVVSSKKDKITLNSKEDVTRDAELVFLDFYIQIENENAVDAEKLLRKRWEIVSKDLNLPLDSISDVRTTSIGVGPITISFKNQSATPVVVYRQDYSIIMQNFAKVGDIQKYLAGLVDQIEGLGYAENSLSVRFEVKFPDELKKRAYLAAIASAKRRAQILAESVGKTLGDPILIKDNSSSLNTSFSNDTKVSALADLYIEFELK